MEERAVLMVVDMQVDFCPGGAWRYRGVMRLSP